MSAVGGTVGNPDTLDGLLAPRRSRMPVDYLQKILTAKVYDVAVETPLELAATLSARLHNRVLLKREDQQAAGEELVHRVDIVTRDVRPSVHPGSPARAAAPRGYGCHSSR